MKIILLTTTLTLLCSILNAQQISYQTFYPHYDCGTWVADSVKTTDWQTIDTLKKPVKTWARNWIVDTEWQWDIPMFVDAVYRPCGNDPSHVEYQLRVCSITGIRQKRFRVYSFHYVEPVKSEYQKTVDRFRKP